MNIRKSLTNSVPRSIKSRSLELPNALVSQLLHLSTFTLEKPKIQFPNATLIFSIDIDVGKKEIGLINKGKNDHNVNNCVSEYQIGEIEEQAFPLILNAFNSYGVPVTFAIRGQLTEVDDSFLPLLINSPVKHDIGSHGYSHRNFQGMTRKEAETELNMLSVGMKKYGLVPKSFIFPRNGVSHLELLEKFGYECYREPGNFLNDGMYIEKRGLLYDVHPGLYLTKNANVFFLKTLLNIAIEKRVPLHLWFHIWTFGETNSQIKETIDRILIPFLKYAKVQEKKNLLRFDTMLSASRKARKLPKNID